MENKSYVEDFAQYCESLIDIQPKHLGFPKYPDLESKLPAISETIAFLKESFARKSEDVLYEASLDKDADITKLQKKLYKIMNDSILKYFNGLDM